MHRTEADTRFLRLKWRRAVDRWRGKAAALIIAAKGGFDPNQPRVPAGNPDGGQWTGSGSGQRRRNPDEGRVISDANPNSLQKPGARLAMSRGPRRSNTGIRFGRQTFPATRRQQGEFRGLELRRANAMERLRQIDPTWKPRPPGAPARDARGAIAIVRGETREAEARIRELSSQGIGPGPFAKESIPARNSNRNFRIDERQEINRMGYQNGCNTCGSREPGTSSGNFVIDHQDPTGLNQAGRPQRLYPQCLTCSLRQGGNVNALKRRGKKK